MTKPFYTSRSAIVAYQRCPRSRYLKHHAEGTGLVPSGFNEDTFIGECVHFGLEMLLKGHYDIDHVIDMVAMLANGLNCDDETIVGGKMPPPETWAIIEATLRGWHLIGLPRLQSEYEVLEIELEDSLELAPNLVLLGRADARLRDRMTKDNLPLSFKTTRSYDSRKAKLGDHDAQGLSEVALLSKRTKLPVLGNRMDYLLTGTIYKGRRKNPLIGGWKKLKSKGGWDYAHSWNWEDVAGDKHTLGKGWTKFNAWEEPFKTKGWIEMLASGHVQPLAKPPLETMFIFPPEYYRNEDEVEDWLSQVTAQEQQIQSALWKLAKAPTCEKEILNTYFPQYRHSCDYPSACEYQPICFGHKATRLNPLASGYEARVPHHKAELVQIQSLNSKGETKD